MNNEHTKYFKMFGNVQTALDENTPIWSSLSIVSVFKNNLDEIILRVDDIYGNNLSDASAATRKKKKIKANIIVKVPILVAAMYVLGDLNDDEKLMGLKGITKSQLDKLKELDMVNQVMALTSLARTNIEALKGFGISDEMITEIETSVDEFKHLIGSARNIRNKQYANIKEADQLIDAGTSLLKNKMDKVMKVFELTHPVFYDVYKRARVIVD